MNQRKARNTSNQDRVHVINAWKSGLRGRQFSDFVALLNVKLRTAYQIVKVWRETGRENACYKGGPLQRWTPEYTDLLVSEIEENPLLTLKEMQAVLYAGTSEHFTESSISKHLQDACITLNKLVKAPMERNRADVIESRRVHAEWFLSARDNIHRVPYYFQDEFGVSL